MWRFDAKNVLLAGKCTDVDDFAVFDKNRTAVFGGFFGCECSLCHDVFTALVTELSMAMRIATPFVTWFVITD